MKHFTKILALILTVLLSASLLPVASLAEEASPDPYAKLKEGVGYVAIGDSFTRGYGAGDSWQDYIYLNDTYGNYECRNVGGSYPNRIAEAFGLYAPDDIRDTSAKLWPIAHDAVSTAYMLDLLGVDDGFRDDEFTYDESYMIERYETDLQYFGDPLSLTVDEQSTYGQTGEVMSIREMLNNASLITIGLGQTDVIYKAQIFGLNTLDMSDTAGLPAGVANIISLLYRYFDYWKDAYPLLLDYIKENNPDAKVVLVGTVNPIKDATLNDEISIKIGSVLNVIFDSMNTYTKACAVKYGYTFVDISDVDTPSAVTQMSIGHILSISDPIEYALIAHPTANGYRQIAEKIIAAVKSDLEKDSAKGKVAEFFTKIIDWFKTFFEKITGFFTRVITG
jgi:lysophospholipase L1-like esterase